MDAATFAGGAEEAVARFDSQYVRLMSAITGSHPLARAMTDTAGAFILEFPRADSVLVFAYAELEGEPFYFPHAVVGGLTGKMLELDMSEGGCAYPWHATGRQHCRQFRRRGNGIPWHTLACQFTHRFPRGCSLPVALSLRRESIRTSCSGASEGNQIHPVAQGVLSERRVCSHRIPKAANKKPPPIRLYVTGRAESRSG